MTDTYKDGVQMERCLFCGSAIRLPTNEPVVNLPISDAERILLFLVSEGMDGAERWRETFGRLQQAVGRSVEQVQAAADQAEGIPDSVKLDRGGLPLEEA